MTTRFWIKLYIEILDDPKMGSLPNHLWRRAVELFLLAGREGNDGALPPVEEMAWKLRLLEDKVLEDLHGLAEVGVVHEAEPGVWFVTHFKERQTCESYDRVKRFRESYRNGESNGQSNGEVAEASSTSTSLSDSDSFKKEGESRELPRSPAEAMLHPDVRVFSAVTGGRIPGLSQYQVVIEAVRLLRAREKLDDAELQAFLAPFWLAWSSRKRLDGRPYDPGNITWLSEWALNGSIPLPGGSKAAESARPAVPTPEETRRMLAEKEEVLKRSVPMPEELRARIRGLAGQLAGKDAHCVGTGTP